MNNQKNEAKTTLSPQEKFKLAIAKAYDVGFSKEEISLLFKYTRKNKNAYVAFKTAIEMAVYDQIKTKNIAELFIELITEKPIVIRNYARLQTLRNVITPEKAQKALEGKHVLNIELVGSPADEKRAIALSVEKNIFTGKLFGSSKKSKPAENPKASKKTFTNVYRQTPSDDVTQGDSREQLYVPAGVTLGELVDFSKLQINT